MIIVYFTSPPPPSRSKHLSKCADFLKFLAFFPTHSPFSGLLYYNKFVIILSAIRLILLNSGLHTNSRLLCPCHSPTANLPWSSISYDVRAMPPRQGLNPLLVLLYCFQPHFTLPGHQKDGGFGHESHYFSPHSFIHIRNIY